MNIAISWDDEAHTIIRFDYHQGWTWDDFSEAARIVNEMVGGRPYHLIANFDPGAFPPMGALGRFKTAQESLPEQTVVIVVGGGLFINTLVAAFSRVYRAISKNLMVAGSLEEARAKSADLRRQSL